LGLDKKTAKTLIYHTVIGSMRLLKEEKFDAESLIVKVASKGGATEAALKVFKENKLNEIIFKGIITACKRAKKLSGR
jgi:pyrroline-5-carboxylate reductase